MALCCMAHEDWAIDGSNSEDASKVAGIDEAAAATVVADGKSAMEKTGGATAACGGGMGGCWGSSIVARWPCKYESSACKPNTYGTKSQKMCHEQGKYICD